VEKGRLGAMPVPLNLSSLPEIAPTDELLDSITGHYANSTIFMRVQKQSNALNLDRYDAVTKSWINIVTGLKLRDDDRFASDDAPSQSFSFIKADGRQYLVNRFVDGLGHYQDDLISAQQVAAAGDLPAAWSGRTGKKWLMTNEHPEYSDKWANPLMQLPAVDNLLFARTGGLQVVNPLPSDTTAGMMLLIPQKNGKELDEVVIETRSNEEWIRFGSYLYRPQETLPALVSETVTIGADGLAQWRSVKITGSKTIIITPATDEGYWRIYNSDLQLKETGKGTRSVTLSTGTYYFLFHSTASVLVK